MIGEQLKEDKQLSQDSIVSVSWQQFELDVMALCESLEGKGETPKLKGIVAVARGGLIPGVMMSHRLEIPMFKSVLARSYGNQKPLVAGLNISEVPKFLGLGRGWLVVDDIADTGKTFSTLRNYWPEAHYVAPYVKPKGCNTVDTFERMFNQGQWIAFPWESKKEPKANEHNSE